MLNLRHHLAIWVTAALPALALDLSVFLEGWNQARETREFLRDKGVEVVYCSPFLRARDSGIRQYVASA